MTTPDSVEIDVYLEQGATYKGILDGDDPATRAVNGIFASLRDRRLLKWLFDAHGPHSVAPGIESIDPSVQREMAEEWREMIRRTFERSDLHRVPG